MTPHIFSPHKSSKNRSFLIFKGRFPCGEIIGPVSARSYKIGAVGNNWLDGC